MHAAITAVAGYVPETRLTNADLEKIVETNHEWIVERTGIHERRILEQGTAPTEMGVKVVQDLLAKKKLSAEAIDLLIVATSTPDHLFPSNSNIIQYRAGLKNATGFDINGACSGFLLAIVTAAQFVETGRYRKVIVIGMDKMSSIIDYQDRNTCVIFGDGAAGVLLEPSDVHGVKDFILKTDGSGKDLLCQPAGGSVLPASHQTVEGRMHFLKQDGRTVFKHAVTGMSSAVKELLVRNQLGIQDVNYVVPHQANTRIIGMVGEQLGIAPEKVLVNIQRYGNTTAATIPLCLWDFEQQFRTGDRLVLTAFGAGFTWGSVYLTWGYDPVAQ